MEELLDPILKAGWVGATVFATFTFGKLADRWLATRPQRPESNGHRSQLETERHATLAHSMSALGDRICDSIENLGDRLERRMDLEREARQSATVNINSNLAAVRDQVLAKIDSAVKRAS